MSKPNQIPSDVTAKRKRLLAAVASIRETVELNAAAGEIQGTLPEATVNALASTGLLGLKLPTVLGGFEADPETQFQVIETLSAIDPAAGWCLMIGGTGVGLPGAFLPDEAIAELFAGGRVPKVAIVGMPTGVATRERGGYRVTGRWAFASGVRHAEWIGLGTQVQRDGDVPPEARMIVLPTASITIHDNWHVAGLKGTGSCDVSIDDCFVPEAFTWDRLKSPPRRGGALYWLGQPGFVANEHAAFAIGVGRGALDAVVEVAKSKRRSFGPSPTSVESRPSFQRAVGLGDIKLRAARALVLETYAAAWVHAAAGRIPPPKLQAEMRSTTVYATETAVDVATEAFRYAGGAAVYAGHKLERHLRDINVAAQHLMVSNIAYETHGQFALGWPDVDPLR